MAILRAPATSTLLHAEASGEKNVLFTLARLLDENGNILKDQDGNTLVAWGHTPVIVLHAEATTKLLHAEDS